MASAAQIAKAQAKSISDVNLRKAAENKAISDAYKTNMGIDKDATATDLGYDIDVRAMEQLQEGAEFAAADTMETCIESIDYLATTVAVEAAEIACEKQADAEYDKAAMIDESSDTSAEEKLKLQVKRTEAKKKGAVDKLAKTILTDTKVVYATISNTDTAAQKQLKIAENKKKEIAMAKEALEKTLGKSKTAVMDSVDIELYMEEAKRSETASERSSCFEVAEGNTETIKECEQIAMAKYQKMSAGRYADATDTALKTDYYKDKQNAGVDKAEQATKAAYALGKTAAEVLSIVKQEMKAAFGSKKDITTTQAKKYLRNAQGAAVTKALVVEKLKADGTEKTPAEMNEDAITQVKQAYKQTSGSLPTPKMFQKIVKEAAVAQVTKQLYAGADRTAVEKAIKQMMSMQSGSTSASSKDPSKAQVDRFRNKMAEKEGSSLKQACRAGDVTASECRKEMKKKFALLTGVTMDDKGVEALVLDGADSAASEAAMDCFDDAAEDATKIAACKTGDIKNEIMESMGLNPETDSMTEQDVQNAIKRGARKSGSVSRTSCIQAADGTALKIEFCNSDIQVEETMKASIGPFVASTDGKTAAIRIFKTEMMESAIGVTALASNAETGDAKLENFHTMIKDDTGVDLKAKKFRFQEQQLRTKAGDKKLIQLARGCQVAGDTICDMEAKYDAITKTDGGRRRRLVSRVLGAATSKQVVQRKAAEAIMIEKLNGCIETKKSKKGTQDCAHSSVDIIDAVMKKEEIPNHLSKARSTIAVQKMMACRKGKKEIGNLGNLGKDECTKLANAAWKDIEIIRTSNTQQEDLKSAMGRKLFEDIEIASACAASDSIHCDNNVKDNMNDLYDLQPEEFEVKRLQAGIEKSAVEISDCMYDDVATADKCTGLGQATFGKITGNTQLFDGMKQEIIKKATSYKNNEDIIMTTSDTEIETCVERAGSCAASNTEDTIHAINGDAKCEGAKTVKLSEGATNNKCLSCFRTLVAKAKSSECVKAIPKIKSIKGSGRRFLTESTSISSSFSQGSSASGSTTTGTVYKDSDGATGSTTTTTATPKTTTPKATTTPSANDIADDEDSSANLRLSDGVHTEQAILACVIALITTAMVM